MCCKKAHTISLCLSRRNLFLDITPETSQQIYFLFLSQKPWFLLALKTPSHCLYSVTMLQSAAPNLCTLTALNEEAISSSFQMALPSENIRSQCKVWREPPFPSCGLSKEHRVLRQIGNKHKYILGSPCLKHAHSPCCFSIPRSLPIPLQ